MVENPPRRDLADEYPQHRRHLLNANGEPQMRRAEQFFVRSHFRRIVKRRLRRQREKADHAEPDVVQQDRPTDQGQDEHLRHRRPQHHIAFGIAVAHPPGHRREQDEGQGQQHARRGFHRRSHRRAQRNERELRQLVVERILRLLRDHAPKPHPMAARRRGIRIGGEWR